jgi:hypothetical protein
VLLETRFQALEQNVDVAGNTKLGLDGEGAATVRRDSVNDLLGGVGVRRIVHGDKGSVAREPLGDGPTNPAARACDQGRLAGELSHYVPPVDGG